MFKINENVRKGVVEVLQQKLLPAKLNPTSNRNVGVLLGWLEDEKLLNDPIATPDAIADVLMVRILVEPTALLWDVAPNFDAPAPTLTKREADSELQRRQSEAEARDIKRRQQEQAENSESAFFERQRQAEASKKIENERLAEEVSARDLQSAILQLEFYRGPGRVDHSRSEEVRKALFGVAVKKDGKVNKLETLRIVRQIIDRLPDNATAATVAQVVSEINRERQRAAEQTPRRDSLGVL